MTSSLLLDTHVVLWLVDGNARLGGRARRAMAETAAAGGSLLVSPVSVWEVVMLDRKRRIRWEVVMLDRKRRIRLNVPVGTWVQTLFDMPAVKPCPVDPLVPVKAYGLPDFDNPDPADRLLIASAMQIGCPLLTYDARITRFARDHGAACGFSVLPV